MRLTGWEDLSDRGEPNPCWPRKAELSHRGALRTRIRRAHRSESWRWRLGAIRCLNLRFDLIGDQHARTWAGAPAPPGWKTRRRPECSLSESPSRFLALVAIDLCSRQARRDPRPVLTHPTRPFSDPRGCGLTTLAQDPACSWPPARCSALPPRSSDERSGSPERGIEVRGRGARVGHAPTPAHPPVLESGPPAASASAYLAGWTG